MRLSSCALGVLSLLTLSNVGNSCVISGEELLCLCSLLKRIDKCCPKVNRNRKKHVLCPLPTPPPLPRSPRGLPKSLVIHLSLVTHNGFILEMLTQLHFEPLKLTASTMPLRKNHYVCHWLQKTRLLFFQPCLAMASLGGGARRQLILPLHAVRTV